MGEDAGTTFALDVMRGMFTVLSNVAILPAAVLMWRRREFDGTILMLKLFWSSTLYHFCQSGYWCLFSFDTLRIVDYVAVFAAVSWTFLFVARVGPRWRGGLVLLIVMQLLSLQLQFGTRWYLALLGVLTIGVPTLVVFVLITIGSPYRLPRRDQIALLVAIVLALAGFAFYFLEGEPSRAGPYPYTHGTWHVFAMFSLLALFFAGVRRDVNITRIGTGCRVFCS